jgi:tRNA dimethylallyltransferase
MNTLPLVVILGQTATGKSAYAVALAQEINGEIISADSRQVYKGLNLGTGKVTKKEMGGIPHHLLDVANPSQQFSVANYQELTKKAIEKIHKKNKIPILVGGTGFYIDAVIHNTKLPEVPPNATLRKKLAKLSAERLLAMLKKIDPLRAQTIDAKNPVRLIRAIEIAKALGHVPKVITTNKYPVIKIGIMLPDEVLKERIHTRLLDRLTQGMLREATRLHRDGLSWQRMEELGLEYRYMARHLQGKITHNQMLQQLENEIWKYAKRQKTWFKRDKEIIWIRVA